MRTKDEFITVLVRIGAEDGKYENERIPHGLLKELFRRGFTTDNWGSGLAALFIGSANQGVDWDGYTGSVPKDPAGLGWAGQRAKKGKHILDGTTQFPHGGLGLAHLDSTALYRDAYKRWGEPYPGASRDKLSFNKLILSKYASRYFDWADSITEMVEFHEWLIEYWLDKFWKPCWEWARSIYYDEGRAMDSSDVSRAAINSRINNSVSGVASRIRKNEVFFDWMTTEPGTKGGVWVKQKRPPTDEEQVNSYQGYKWSRRSKRAAARALRQARQASRVGVLYHEFRLPIVAA